MGSPLPGSAVTSPSPSPGLTASVKQGKEAEPNEPQVSSRADALG